MTTLLSVDWDYFFPNPMLSERAKGQPLMFDWGAKENALFEGPMLWDTRAATFLTHKLPLPGTSREKTGFWDRFTFSEDTCLYVADSHAYAALLASQEGVREVWNFDAHHDGGYSKRLNGESFVACDNWLKVCHEDMAIPCHVRYPLWNPDGGRQIAAPAWADARVYDPGEELPRFDVVFVCRSPAWVPTWLDKQFVTFVHAAHLPIEDIGGTPDHLHHPMVPRPFSRKDVLVEADFLRVYREAVRT